MRAKFSYAISASLLLAGSFAAYFTYSDSSTRLDSEISSLLNAQVAGNLEDLAPVSDFLSAQWARSPEDFDRAADRFFRTAESRKITVGFESVLRVFERSHPNFCEGLNIAELSEKPGEYCEWRSVPLPKLPKVAEANWVPPNCDAYSRPKNRQKCLKAVWSVLSKFSDAHCSDATCKNDQAAYRALVVPKANPISVCASGASVPIRKRCEAFVSEALSPPVPSEEDVRADAVLRAAIEWESTDPVASAIRRAAFSEDSSPSEECATVPAGEVSRCESLAKAAFDYVERERTKARITRIRAAAEEESGRSDK